MNHGGTFSSESRSRCKAELSDIYGWESSLHLLSWSINLILAIFPRKNCGGEDEFISSTSHNNPPFLMPDVGIIGLSPTWESRYLPVLRKLRNRVRVRAVYDPVFCRAQHAALELEADVSEGIHSLVNRRDLRAVLVLDSSWQSTYAIKCACETGKPCI